LIVGRDFSTSDAFDAIVQCARPPGATSNSVQSHTEARGTIAAGRGGWRKPDRLHARRVV